MRSRSFFHFKSFLFFLFDMLLFFIPFFFVSFFYCNTYSHLLSPAVFQFISAIDFNFNIISRSSTVCIYIIYIFFHIISVLVIVNLSHTFYYWVSFSFECIFRRKKIINFVKNLFTTIGLIGNIQFKHFLKFYYINERVVIFIFKTFFSFKLILVQAFKIDKISFFHLCTVTFIHIFYYCVFFCNRYG